MSSKHRVSMLIGLLLFFQPPVVSGATFEDSVGRLITLKAPPQRIVCLAPNLTEILYYIGMGDKIVGVTQFSNYPPEAARKQKIGSYSRLNIEKIISLDPDLAIGTVDGNMPGVVKLLEQARIPVFVVNPRKVKDVISTVDRLGQLCGVGEKARSLSQKLARRVDMIESATKGLTKPLVFLQINVNPIMTVNKNTFHHDVIRMAGGENMAKDERFTYPRISMEEVIRRNPEVIIISSMERGEKYEEARKEWLKWTSVPAVRDGRVHLMESDLLDRPSPRIAKGLEIMAELLHPHAIK